MEDVASTEAVESDSKGDVFEGSEIDRVFPAEVVGAGAVQAPRQHLEGIEMDVDRVVESLTNLQTSTLSRAGRAAAVSGLNGSPLINQRCRSVFLSVRWPELNRIVRVITPSAVVSRGSIVVSLSGMRLISSRRSPTTKRMTCPIRPLPKSLTRVTTVPG